MEKYLGRCLDSLLHQDIPKESYEIIVVNDGSKDTTLTIAQEYTAKYPSIVVLDKPNGGIGSARNAGLAIAKGTYLYFVDPDDYIAPNVLGIITKLLVDNDLDLLAFDFVDLPMNVATVEDKPAVMPTSIDIKTGIELVGARNFTNEAWWYVSKRALLTEHKIDFMEDRLMEDVIFTQQVLLSAQRTAHIPLDVYRYITLPNSVRTSKEPKHYRRFIFDCEYVVFLMATFYSNIDLKEKHEPAFERLKTKQQSIAFFILLRLAKSDISFKYLAGMIHRFKKVDAYPFTYFPGKDFNGITYKILASILNNSLLRGPVLRILRGTERIRYRLKI